MDILLVYKINHIYYFLSKSESYFLINLHFIMYLVNKNLQWKSVIAFSIRWSLSYRVQRVKLQGSLLLLLNKLKFKCTFYSLILKKSEVLSPYFKIWFIGSLVHFFLMYHFYHILVSFLHMLHIRWWCNDTYVAFLFLAWIFNVAHKPSHVINE